MLDAYIIEKIKREQERDHAQRAPLQIPTPRWPEPEPRPRWEDDHDKDDPPDRGVVIIDF